MSLRGRAADIVRSSTRMPVIMGERCGSVGGIEPKFEIDGDIGLAYGTSLVDDDGTRVRVICGDFCAGAVRSRGLRPTRGISMSGSRRAEGCSGRSSLRRDKRTDIGSRAGS